MDSFLYFIRDNLVGIHYFIYAFALLFFMFSIIGYLFKQKYAVYEIKLNTSQGKVDDKKEEKTKSKKEIKKETKISKSDEKKDAKDKIVQKVEEKKEVKKEVKNVVTPVKEVKETVVTQQSVKPKETINTPIKEIEVNVSKPKEVVNTHNIQLNQVAPQVSVPIPTPLPATPEVKNPVNIPATGESVVVKPLENKQTTEVKKTVPTAPADVSKPIPELK